MKEATETFNTYTTEECGVYASAIGILDKIGGVCSALRYNDAKTEEESKAIVEFAQPYGRLRVNLSIDDKDKIAWVRTEAVKLVAGDPILLTKDYILMHPNNGQIGI